MGEMIGAALALMMVAALTVIMLIGFTETSQGIYECIDTQGNTVECYMVTVDRGTSWGYQKDGTRLQVIEYRRIK